MLKYLFVTYLLGQVYGFRSDVKGIGGRIVNGTEAEDGEFPFAALLRESAMNTQSCGASILNKNFILTAGRCVKCSYGKTDADPSDYNIQYGLVRRTTDDTNSVNITQIHCNNLTTTVFGVYYEYTYDTAILELAESLPDDGSWKPVTLARVFNSSVQQEGVVIGWGGTLANADPFALQKVTLNVYNDTVCDVATRGHSDHHLCTGSIGGHSGPCYGDNGSPALVDGLQVGITSYLTNPSLDCGEDSEKYPKVYAKIEKYFDWIHSITPDIKSN